MEYSTLNIGSGFDSYQYESMNPWILIIGGRSYRAFRLGFAVVFGDKTDAKR